MAGLRDDELDSIRETVNQFLPGRSTNSRTSITSDVYISAATQSYRISGMPSFLRIPAWDLEFPDGHDIHPGDREVESGAGTYTVSEVFAPADYSLSTPARAVLTADANGIPLLPFASNAAIIFKRPITAETTASIPVFIRRADHMTDPRSEDGTPAYEWHMTYPIASAYVSDSTKPGVNHYILWSEFPAVEPTIAEQPDRVTNQFFGLAGLYFNTTG